MRGIAGAGIVAVMLAGSAAIAQTAVTTSGGTANAVPVYTGSATLGNSPISISGGNVGIGTTTPGNTLTVLGNLQFDKASIANSQYSFYSVGWSATNPFPSQAVNTDWSGVMLHQTFGNGDTHHLAFSIYTDNQNSPTYSKARLNTWRDGSGVTPDLEFDTNSTPQMTIKNNGNVGIGTTDPGALLDVSGPGANIDVHGSYNANLSLIPSDTGAQTYILSAQGAGADLPAGQLDFYNSSLNTNVMTFSGSNVGIGTTSPGAKLEVDGNVKLTANSGASITFADGTVQSTAYTGVSCGGDFAESVDVTGKRTLYAPSDVLVIDPKHPGEFLEASQPYSTLVAGIYSTRPGFVGRRLTGPKGADEVPMAMVGIVPTKVTAENGPIHTGDLLVTSSIPGRAMKGTDPSRLTGAVVGKALGNLDSGTGTIEVLVTLQ